MQPLWLAYIQLSTSLLIIVNLSLHGVRSGRIKHKAGKYIHYSIACGHINSIILTGIVKISDEIYEIIDNVVKVPQKKNRKSVVLYCNFAEKNTKIIVWQFWLHCCCTDEQFDERIVNNYKINDSAQSQRWKISLCSFWARGRTVLNKMK